MKTLESAPAVLAQDATAGRLKKVLVLVLSFDKEPYRSIELQGQRRTWAATALPNVPVLYYYGITNGFLYWSVASVSKLMHQLGQPRLRSLFLRRIAAVHGLRASEKGDRIDVRVPDIYGTIGTKTIGALRHVLKHHSFDYLFRTNTSSYVFLPLLSQFVQSLPQHGYYGGSLGRSLNTTFAAGAGILLSRDLVEYAAQDAAWDWDLIDDLALARSMARAGVFPRDIPRIDVLSADEVPRVGAEKWRACFHIRCKSAVDRLLDIGIMKNVHAAYQAAWPKVLA